MGTNKNYRLYHLLKGLLGTTVIWSMFSTILSMFKMISHFCLMIGELSAVLCHNTTVQQFIISFNINSYWPIPTAVGPLFNTFVKICGNICPTPDMMTSSSRSLPALLALCTENSPVIGEFPSQGDSNADFDVSLMWVHISSQTNSRMTGDLRLHDVRITLW